MVICEPGSIRPYKTFKAEVYILTEEEGGRHTPFSVGYRPQFYIRTTDVAGSITSIRSDGVLLQTLAPGDRAETCVELICGVAVEKGMRFAIREGGRTVGAGVVTELIE